MDGINRKRKASDLSKQPKRLELASAVCHLRQCLDQMVLYQPKLVNIIHVNSQDSSKVSLDQRNQSAHTLKCLSSFYGYQGGVFSLALNTLDRFITKVKVQPRYLSCVLTTCLYQAAMKISGHENAPHLNNLISVSQSECRPSDITRMEQIILSKLRPAPDEHAVTALTLLDALRDVLLVFLPEDFVIPSFASAQNQLLLCLCQAELFEGASPAMLSLAVLSAHLSSSHRDNLGCFDQRLTVAFTHLLNICQLADCDFFSYEKRITSFLVNNYSMPRSTARSQLRWAISNRTKCSLRPSLFWTPDLPTIQETTIEHVGEQCECERNYVNNSGVLEGFDIECELPGTPCDEDFNHHFSYPNSPSESSPIANSFPKCPLLTYSDIVSGRLHSSDTVCNN